MTTWDAVRAAIAVPAEQERRPKRIDPHTCGCTDCITGYSVPLDYADPADVLAMVHGKIDNATSMSLSELATWLEGKR